MNKLYDFLLVDKTQIKNWAKVKFSCYKFYKISVYYIKETFFFGGGGGGGRILLSKCVIHK